jgi:hypothetical protein
VVEGGSGRSGEREINWSVVVGGLGRRCIRTTWWSAALCKIQRLSGAWWSPTLRRRFLGRGVLELLVDFDFEKERESERKGEREKGRVRV